jgi:hypothetical protein
MRRYCVTFLAVPEMSAPTSPIMDSNLQQPWRKRIFLLSMSQNISTYIGIYQHIIYIYVISTYYQHTSPRATDLGRS